MKRITLLISTLAFILVCTLQPRTCKAQWQQTSAPHGESIYCIATSGTNIFAGTFGGGVLMSTNNGSTWTTKNNGLTYLYVSALAIYGSNIFAGTYGGGIYLSTNNGSTWTAVNNGMPYEAFVSSIAISGDGSYIYAATEDDGVYLSTNNGSSWTAVNNGLANVTDTDMLSVAVNGSYVYAGASYGGGAYTSSDSGAVWIGGGLATEVYSLVASGTNVYAGTYSGVFLSTNHGITWTPVDNGFPSYIFYSSKTLLYPSVYSLVADTGRIIAGTYGDGVFLSTDSGNFWSAFNTGGLAGNQVMTLAIGDSDIFAGTNNGYIWKRPITDLITCAPVITTSSTEICQGSTATLSASAGSAYLWSNGGTAQNIVVSDSGNYSCIINTNCGNLPSNVIHISVKSSPVATITSSGATTFCSGGHDTLTASSGSSYLWSNGQITSSITVTSSQRDSVTILAANGCLATSPAVNIVSLSLPVIISQPKNDTVTVGCTALFLVGDSLAGQATYQWQVNIGSGYNSVPNSGIYSGANSDTLSISNTSLLESGYTYHLIISNSGCNVTSASASLTVIPVKTTSQTDTLCAGDSLVVGIYTHNATGTYTDTLPTIAGCDSIIITTHLVIDSIVKHSQTVTLCAGDSFTVGIHTYDTSGTYIDSLQNGRGCDSIVTTKLTIDSIIRKTQTITLCEGLSQIVGMDTLNTTGTFIDTLKNGRGCDSIVTTHLTITPASKSSQTVTLCAGDNFTIGIHTYDTSGTYHDTLTTGSGCDSIVTTTLAIDSIFNITQTIMLCAGDSLIVGPYTHDTSGTFHDTIPNGKGCDSIVISHLTIKAISFSQTVTLCAGDSLIVGTHTYDSSGTYMDSFITNSGCDSIVTTNLTFFNYVVKHGDTLTAKGSPAIYQWFNCVDIDSILSTKQSFTPAEDGDYAVIVTANGCTDTSTCFSVIVSGIAVNTLNYAIAVYPNPANNQLTIHASSVLTDKMVTISVVNMLGEVMQEEKLKWSSDESIDISNLSAGMYFLQMKSENGIATEKFIKE